MRWYAIPCSVVQSVHILSDKPVDVTGTLQSCD